MVKTRSRSYGEEDSHEQVDPFTSFLVSPQASIPSNMVPNGGLLEGKEETNHSMIDVSKILKIRLPVLALAHQVRGHYALVERTLRAFGVLQGDEPFGGYRDVVDIIFLASLEKCQTVHSFVCDLLVTGKRWSDVKKHVIYRFASPSVIRSLMTSKMEELRFRGTEHTAQFLADAGAILALYEGHDTYERKHWISQVVGKMPKSIVAEVIQRIRTATKTWDIDFADWQVVLQWEDPDETSISSIIRQTCKVAQETEELKPRRHDEDFYKRPVREEQPRRTFDGAQPRRPYTEDYPRRNFGVEQPPRRSNDDVRAVGPPSRFEQWASEYEGRLSYHGKLSTATVEELKSDTDCTEARDLQSKAYPGTRYIIASWKTVAARDQAIERFGGRPFSKNWEGAAPLPPTRK